jgi:N-acetylneuraminic acid mutarotase
MNTKISYWRLVFYMVLFVGLSACCEDVATVPITEWTQLSTFPGAPRASATGFSYETTGFVCCGRTGSKDGFLNELWAYDSQTDTWSKKTDFPGDPRVKAVGCVIGDKAYVGLGATQAYDTTKQFKDFWEYDISTDTWTQKASFPSLGSNDLTFAVVDSCLYTTLGFSNVERCKETYRYDPLTNTWTALADAPVRYSCAAGFSIDKDFYAGTGYDGHNNKKFFRFRTDENSWSRVADLPEGRILSKGLAIGEKGYIMLGRHWAGDQNGGGVLSDILEYDPNENAWTRRGDFPGGGRQNNVVFTIAGKGYILLGEDDDERKADVWMFQP